MRDLVLARVMLSFCDSSSSSRGSMLPKKELTLMASSLDCRCDGAIKRISDSHQTPRYETPTRRPPNFFRLVCRNSARSADPGCAATWLAMRRLSNRQHPGPIAPDRVHRRGRGRDQSALAASSSSAFVADRAL